MQIPILDLSQQYKTIKKDIFAALGETMQRGDFILGEEEKIFELEKETKHDHCE